MNLFETLANYRQMGLDSFSLDSAFNDEIISLFGDYDVIDKPCFVVIGKTRYIVTYTIEQLSACDVNDTKEYFSFIREFDMKEIKLRRFV